MTEKLGDFSKTQNIRTIKRLSRVMAEHGLTRAEVAYLLSYSKASVTRWFKHDKRCPENAPDLLRAILIIRSPESIREEIIMKRQKSH